MRRVVIAGFKHETNTFSPLPTDLAAYAARSLRRGDEVPKHFQGTATEIGAFLDAAQRYGWQLVHPIAADATPSGRVTREAYETIVSEILAAIPQGSPPDAVLLALHGAMVAEHHDDGEGELLRRVRERVGPKVPIGASLDLHANVTDDMARNADVLVSYRTYPHIDQYETGLRAAELIEEMLGGGALRTQVARGKLLDGVDHGRTTAPGPMLETLALADAVKARDRRVREISVNAGFPWADMNDSGPSVLVVGEPDVDGAAIAAELMDYVWKTRSVVTVKPHALDAGITAIRTSLGGKGSGPVVVADYADNPGGGGLNDSTAVLGAILELAASDKSLRGAYATICDPEALAAMRSAGEGATVSLRLGGKISADFQGPLTVTGTVLRLTDGRFAFTGPMSRGNRIDMGPTAVLRVHGIDLVVAGTRHQSLDPGFFTHAGIVPEEQDLLVVKSAQHFRAAFGPMSREIVVIDSGDGLTSYSLKSLPYTKVRRPVFPLDAI